MRGAQPRAGVAAAQEHTREGPPQIRWARAHAPGRGRDRLRTQEDMRKDEDGGQNKAEDKDEDEEDKGEGDACKAKDRCVRVSSDGRVYCDHLQACPRRCAEVEAEEAVPAAAQRPGRAPPLTRRRPLPVPLAARAPRPRARQRAQRSRGRAPPTIQSSD